MHVANTNPSAGLPPRAPSRHFRLRQDLRVHDDDVGHGYKCREAAQHFLFNGGFVFGEFEVTIDQSSSFSEKCFRRRPERAAEAHASTTRFNNGSCRDSAPTLGMPP